MGLSALTVLFVPLAAAAQGPCANVTCGGHGACFTEDAAAFCLCEDGYEAVGTDCRASTTAAGAHPDLRWLPDPGFRIVGIAVQEAGHSLDEVGVERRSGPGPLAEFVREGAYWCSDFVSWVYRVAGVPFSGGYEGGWLVPTNAAIQRWFERHDAWVSRDSRDFASFVPRPGDYVRIRTDTWGHSAIVRYVEGDTLYLVEGNARGTVRTTRYRRFRQNERIEGFGLATH